MRHAQFILFHGLTCSARESPAILEQVACVPCQRGNYGTCHWHKWRCQQNLRGQKKDIRRYIDIYITVHTVHACKHSRCCIKIYKCKVLRTRQNGHHFADDNFKRIFLNENARISIEISLKFVPKGRINNIPSLFKIMAWRRPGDKPSSEPMMVRLPTHIWVARPQWLKGVTP